MYAHAKVAGGRRQIRMVLNSIAGGDGGALIGACRLLGEGFRGESEAEKGSLGERILSQPCHA